MIVGMSMKMYFSIQHLKSAAYFCDRAKVVESEYDGDPQSESLSIVRAYATSAIFLSVAFLEALINELFADAKESKSIGLVAELQEDDLVRIAEVGTNKKLKDCGLLKKFEIYLEALGKTPISTEYGSGQDMQVLIYLRNKLLHYKGPWLDMATENMSRHGNFRTSDEYRRIVGKFEPRARTTPHAADYWLGAGCAHWALTSALDFAYQFFSQLGVSVPFAQICDELGLKVSIEN